MAERHVHVEVEVQISSSRNLTRFSAAVPAANASLLGQLDGPGGRALAQHIVKSIRVIRS